MADEVSQSNLFQSQSQPPPAPPLPPSSRPSVIQRFIGPLAFTRSIRQQGLSVAQSNSASPKDDSFTRPHRSATTQKAIYEVGRLSIAAIDINERGTHAVLAGKDILKIISVQNQRVHDDFDVREAVNNHIASRGLRPDEVHKRRDYLPAKDVRWSRKKYSHVIATAALHGRIALYDVTRLNTRVELDHIYEHKGQVNKLDFDPHAGYMLLSGSQDKWCRLWDIRGPAKPRGHSQYFIRAPVRDVRWCPTDAYEFALCTEEGAVQKWDIRNPQQPLIGISKAHEKACYTLAWHPDGKHIASGSLDKSLKVWDFRSESSRANRQKPAFQLRCPGPIMNLAWRPSCWSAEFAECGSWQTTQIATSYNASDPRVHVWDFRRPLVAFKELNQYATRPTDFLWASKDLIWTVGESGFTQNDMSWAEKPEDSMPPGVIAFAPDGSFYAVTENRDARNRPAQTDPTALFLNIPQERLSGTDDGQMSRSLTDDEGVDVSFADQSSRRQSKAASRSAKSQTNTPPPHEDQHRTLPLDRAVLTKKGMFVNGQVGAMSQIPGIYEPAEVTQAFAERYARPLTAAERESDPNSILAYLGNTFQYNRSVALGLGFRDEAENWDLLEKIVLPELTDWADNNRKGRLQRKAEEEASKRTSLNATSPYSKISNNLRSPGQPEKAVSHLLRGLMDQPRGSSDSGSHAGSNMTTPRQQATFSSPGSTFRQHESTWFNIDDAIDPIQPLPPSLANAHSTAGIASRALIDNTSDLSYSPLTSPQRPVSTASKDKGHRRSTTETSEMIAAKNSTRPDINPAAANLSPALLTERTQDQRSAALRDYRAPTRQPFSLETPLVNAASRQERHDSSESFSMFPASTSGSGKGLSFAQSEEVTGSVPGEAARFRQDSEEWDRPTGYYSVGQSTDSDLVGFEMDESPSLPPNFDGASESKPVGPKPIEQQFRVALARSSSSQAEARPRAPSAPMVVPLPRASETRESHFPFTRRALPMTNPFLSSHQTTRKLVTLASDDPSLQEPYEISDFRPIDITEYEPACLGWSSSAYPTICSAIELDGGRRGAQFAVFLICYLHPFFFDQSTNKPMTAEYRLDKPRELFQLYQHPAYRQRLIQTLFVTHLARLQSLRIVLSWAELRKFVVEKLGYRIPGAASAQPKASSAVGDQLRVDPRKLRSTCSQCKQPMPLNARFCKNCNLTRQKCSICEEPLAVAVPDLTDMTAPTQKPALLTYCHICGHSLHQTCMSEWLAMPDAHGECPVENCGCGCAPGKIRDERIARGISERDRQRDEREAVRSSISSTTLIKDPLKAETSPAVAQARQTLRKRNSGGHGVEGERGTQSSDERTTPSSGGTSASAWSRKGTSAGRGIVAGTRQSVQGATNGGLAVGGGASSGTSGGTSFGRRVRLIEPDEEDAKMREG